MWWQVALPLLAGLAQVASVTLEAQVSSGGVKGSVTFTQDNPGDNVNVSVSLTGPNFGEAATWQLHTYRLNYDVSDRCSVNNLGPRILSGGAVSNGDTTITGVELSGSNSIEGRSIAFLKADSTPLACATVESAEEYLTASATFRNAALGHVIFRQQAAAPTAALTRVTSDLYSDGSHASPLEYEWRVVEGAGCSTVRTAYNPNGISGGCNSNDHDSCAVGDLTGKLGRVTVGATMGSTRSTSADLNLPLSGSHRVAGKTLQLIVSGQATPLACAEIVLYNTRTGITTFDNDGVTGTVTMIQKSPLDPTMTHVNLTNVRSIAGGYHVHKYPVPQRVKRDDSVCSGANVAGHYNPFGIIYNASSPGPAVSTEDMYEVGDLSRKYGLLSGLDSLTATYRDYNLPLFGPHSQLGRSIVIHYDQPGTPRWICANIEDTEASIWAQVTFTYPVIGHVLLQQRTGQPMSETSVYYSLDYGDGTTTSSTGHGWTVHDRPAGNDTLNQDTATRCASAGSVPFNPTSVATGGNYSAQCGPGNPLRCQAGDLTGKHGAVGVRGSGGGRAIGFFTDVLLPLQGPDSVVGKAVVLTAADGGQATVACANILQVRPLRAEANSWGNVNHGTLTFSQEIGVVQAPTTLQLDLRSLPTDGDSDYSVDDGPVAEGGDRCGNLGEVYNPLQAVGISTKDTRPMGDLSGKFGRLTGPNVTRTDLDPTLNLWGPRSVTGRALSVTSAGGSSLACASITPQAGNGGRVFSAKAVFAGGDVVGEIRMTQVVYADGAVTPTTVTVDLRKASGNQTQNHNWHTHERVVSGDATASSGRCSSTGGHYNPFRVNVQANYNECGPGNPLRCELGDQSKKLGTYNMGSGPMVASDVYLPLAGRFGVIGRSIVVHAAERGAPRIACADILPSDITHTYHLTVTTQATLNKADMINQLATAIHTETYNLALKVTSPNQQGCVDVRVYFLGMGAEDNAQRFNNLVGGDKSALGAYQPVTCCAALSMTSLGLLLLSLLVTRLLS